LKRTHLRLTRNVGQLTYLGRALDTKRKEETFEIRLWARKISAGESQGLILNTQTKSGVSEELLVQFGDEITATANDLSIGVMLMGIESWVVPESKEYQVVPSALIRIEAPQDCKILRGNARRKF
tara:strand:+ start:399 stop:773 length:375 start_codon:yes stop_codon:yes gene_type:complete